MDNSLLSTSTDDQRLSELQQRFEHWRASKTSRGERIPEALWSEVIELSKRLPHGRLCRVLRLGGHDLKRRLGLAVPRRKKPRTQALSLVEVTEAISSTAWPAAAELTIERRDGARLQLSYPGAVAELSPIIAQFLAPS